MPRTPAPGFVGDAGGLRAAPAVLLVNACLWLPSTHPALLPALPSLPTYFHSCLKQAQHGGRAAMAARASHWHSYLGAIVSRERQWLEHFQKAEDILLTLLEGVHAREPRFLVDYARNLEAFEFALRASEDAVIMEVPLRIDGNALRVLACQPGDTPDGHHAELGTCYLEVSSPGTDLEDWTSTVGVMERGGGAGCLVPGKVLQHLKELLVSAIVRCQHCFVLQPGDLSAESLQEDAMELSLLIRGGWKTIRFDIVPVVRRQQEPLRLKGRRRDRSFPEGSLQKATEEAHFIPASPHCWRSSTHIPILKLLQEVDTLKGSHLDSLRLLNQLRSQDWREEGGEGGLTFNHLKMVLLWSTELFPSPEDWQDLEGSVYRLLVILLRCLATRHLPHFLHPEENLFQGEALVLASLYCKVESFARDPRRFLRFHFGLPAHTDNWQADPSTQALLHLPTKDRSYWDTSYFDILLSQFQVYRIQDGTRHSAMSQLLSKIRREILQQS
ncbi:LOW QUALITY PROTEIN: protein mab-21-like 4 [Tyto alba]|uniref:LOW QUALITY PROTEIN: protein mab-21-like 4 n=1 Tax=Tyto alba TaxID=56313 RepID=UPI001C67FD89|nr:LOW QUALITY PROTEIN: protein mab-21-like 4 [Tyto alba]